MAAWLQRRLSVKILVCRLVSNFQTHHFPRDLLQERSFFTGAIPVRAGIMQKAEGEISARHTTAIDVLFGHPRRLARSPGQVHAVGLRRQFVSLASATISRRVPCSS